MVSAMVPVKRLNQFHLASRLHVNHVSKALGATASTTTKLATINAVATNVTIRIVPLDAGNLPRIT